MSPNTAVAEFRQSWRIVLAGWVGAVFGQNGFAYASFGVFLDPLAKDFHQTNSAISAWIFFYFLGNTIASPILGHVADRIGARKVLVISIPAFALTWVLASQLAPRLWLLYAIALAAGVVATGAGQMAYQRVVTTWYRLGRGAALGIVSSGIGLSYSFSRIVQHTVDYHGWRSGFLLIGAGCLIPWILVLPWIHERGEDARMGAVPATHSESGYSVAEALKMAAFWLIGGALVLYGLGAGGVTVNMISFMTAGGLTRETAASTYIMLGIFSTAGRITTGFVIDRVHAALVCCIILLVQAAAFTVFATTGIQFARVAISATGFAFGGEVCCIGYLVARYFGVRKFGTILGLLTVVSSLGVSSGPLLFGWLHDHSGAYRLPFLVAAGIAAAAAACFGILVRYPFFKAALPAAVET